MQPQLEEEAEAAKATQSELWHSKKLIKEKEKGQNHVRCAREKEERSQLKAKKAEETAGCKAEQERWDEEKDCAKAL